MGRTPRDQWGLLFNPFGSGIIHMGIFYPLTPPAMAETYKILAQAQPTADTWTDLYEVPSATQLNAGIILAAALTTAADKVSIALAIAGAAQDDTQIIYASVPLMGNDTIATIPSLRGQATDVIRVKSLNGSVVFTLLGTLVT